MFSFGKTLLECLKSSIKILCIYFYFPIATLIGEGVRRRNLSLTLRFPSFNNYGSPLSYKDCFNLFCSYTYFVFRPQQNWMVSGKIIIKCAFIHRGDTKCIIIGRLCLCYICSLFYSLNKFPGSYVAPKCFTVFFYVTLSLSQSLLNIYAFRSILLWVVKKKCNIKQNYTAAAQGHLNY